MRNCKFLFIYFFALIVFLGLIIPNASCAQEKNNQKTQNSRMVVPGFLRGLLNLAKEQGGVGGAQIGEIVKGQIESIEKLNQGISKIEKRSKISTFLFGSGYRNLGQMRSELVQTRNRIEQLKMILEQTTDEEDRAELRNQIQIMERLQRTIEGFIKSQEEKFSLFGWLAKIVTGYNTQKSTTGDQ